MLTHLWAKDRKAGKVAFAGEKALQSLICSIYLTLPVRPVEGKGIPPGVPTGSSTLSPVPLCLPLAALKVASRGRLSSLEAEKRAGRRQEDRKQRRGRKEVRKRRTGPDPPLTPSSISLQESNRVFPKIFTVCLN